MFFPQPRNLQNEIGKHVHETDGFDGDYFRASQQKYTVENASIGCSGKFVRQYIFFFIFIDNASTNIHFIQVATSLIVMQLIFNIRNPKHSLNQH